MNLIFKSGKIDLDQEAKEELASLSDRQLFALALLAEKLVRQEEANLSSAMSQDTSRGAAEDYARIKQMRGKIEGLDYLRSRMITTIKEFQRHAKEV